MNQKAYALTGIEKFKQRMQRGNNAQTNTPGASAGNSGASMDKPRRSTTPNVASKDSLNDRYQQKQSSRRARDSSFNKNQTQKESKKQDIKMPPKFMQKVKLDQLMGECGQQKAKDQANKNKSEEIDKEKTESAKQTPKNTGTLDKMMDHHGSTASFAIKETFEKIQAKLESAQRRQKQFNFGRQKGGQADGSKEFELEAEHQRKVNQFGQQDQVQKEDGAGRTDKSTGGARTRKVQGKTSRSSRRDEPIEEVDEYESGEEMEESIRSNAVLDQTPPAQNESTQRSKKTRMGSTDQQGNRLSNMPGEERPSLASVTPYDDHPDQLVTKVEKIISEAQQEKANTRRRAKASTKKEHENSLAQLQSEHEELANSKKALKNGGAPVERNNFVRINQNKMGKYKPALRGAAFQNKIMAKKTNVMKFRRRQQAKIMAERSANNVSAYGGLGAHGLDFGEDGCHGGGVDKQKELEGSFSRTAMQYAALKSPISEEEDLLVGDDIQREVKEELQKIDQELMETDKESQDDRAPHEIPNDTAGYEKVLREEFGHQTFKEGQLKAVQILLEEKRNALVVLATGGGKSLCYQFASQFLPGLVLVVTPLISLMTDQLQKLPDFIPGAALNSQQQFSTKQDVIKAVQQHKIKVLFITPERLFMEDLSKFGRQISMVCVDEIHCASEWSHNFRPAYLVLHDMIKEKLGAETRVIGLTATATRAAQEQICQIFDIKFPEHIVTQVDLSRMNLQLSITRDSEKQTALLALLRSPSYQKLTSILIFATQRRTTDQLAAILNQHGIKSSSYHAGKTDDQRSRIQKDFITGRTRVLCCTIAFSMGIDKSDIESVIHYDIPRSIENYVQEIGRAGRDGKLARCHMFLRNDDFYQLRRITLSDLLDGQSALQLTNKIIVEAKKKFHKLKFATSELPQPKAQTKKRKRNEVFGGLDSDQEDGDGKIIEEFKQEDALKDAYQEKKGISFIDVAEELHEQEDQKLFVAIGVKGLLASLDLKKEVVLTMLNQLEKLKGEKAFMRVDSILPVGVQLRFYKKQLDELAEGEAELPRSQQIYTCFQKLATSKDGVYRCHLLDLAKELRVKPYSIPKMLYQLQHATNDDVAYDLDKESFVIEFTRIPSQKHIFELTEDMLAETRKVEKNLISKLNCMYFAARKVSLPSVDYMMRIENEAFENSAKAGGDGVVQTYLDCSAQLNELINLYFSARKEDDIELKIAGNAEERALMMPLLYIDGDPEAKQQIAEYILRILKEFHQGDKAAMLAPSNRMKPLDVVKVLMGINSSRESVRRFQYVHQLWAKCHEYDYEQMLQVAEESAQAFYCEALAVEESKSRPAATLRGKRKKVEEDDGQTPTSENLPDAENDS